MDNLKKMAVRGGLAKLCGQAANFALRIFFIAVMARLLDPRDFGLVAMVTAVTGFYELFTSAGLSAATIQRAQITEQQISTLFWINVAVGLGLALLCFATAPALVQFYNEPGLYWVTIALGGGFVCNALGVQHSALLNRDLRFLELTAIDVFSRAASTAIGIGSAFAGCGYWSLVWSSLAFVASNTICVWIATGWVPGWVSRNVGIRSMLRFGGTVTLNSVVIHVAYNLEKVLIGRYWGADMLGIYGRAYQLISIPADSLHSAVGSVVFSALSRIQDDEARLRSYFLKGYTLVNSLTLPLTIFCALFADDIIAVFLGPKWAAAALVFRLLTPTVLVLGAINPTVWLLWSTGRQNRSLWLALVIAPLVMSAYLIGLPFGPNGVAFAYSTAMVVWLVPHIIWSLNGTPISPKDLFFAVSRPLVAAIVAGGVAWAASFYLARIDLPLLRLLMASGIMAVIYSSLLLFVLGQKDFYLSLVRGLVGKSA